LRNESLRALSGAGEILGGLRHGGAGTGLAAAFLALLALGLAAAPGTAGGQTPGLATIKSRHVGVARTGAAALPRSEADQPLVDGWPLYRTERGQAAFNDAMAALKATDGPPPQAAAFKGCAALECHLALPQIGADGWIPPGRIWVSPSEYVLVAHSPRYRSGQPYRRRTARDMRYFVLHEFHNGTRNTDPYDTISSHSGAVFVPFYMSKQTMDAKGRRFVVVVQVAPYDVMSIHASDKGSAGPGMEVAKNVNEALEPLQGQAGTLIATMVKAAAPHLRVVNHRGSEGRPMLEAYERRLAALRARPGAARVALPFVPATAARVAAASSRLEELIVRRGLSPRIPVAERPFVRAASLAPAVAERREPVLIEPVLIEPIRPAVPPPQRQPACSTVGDAYLAARCRQHSNEP
jgi:hypothetical protein